MTITGTNKVLLGTNEQGEKIFITKPEWDCNWYWSFGYLGNKNCHYQLNNYQNKNNKIRNKNMYDCLTDDYKLNPKIEENLWQFCELALTIYTLKEAAEVIGLGGSHMTKNYCEDIIKNPEETKRLNEVVIPTLCQTLWNLIGGN